MNFGHVAEETSVFNNAACHSSPALGDRRGGEAEEVVDTEHPIPWFSVPFFPFLNLKTMFQPLLLF